MKKLNSLFILCCWMLPVLGQPEAKSQYKTIAPVEDLKNAGFMMAYQSAGELFTYNNIRIEDMGNVEEYCFNPTGSSIAIIRRKDKVVDIYSFLQQNEKIGEIKEIRKRPNKNVYYTSYVTLDADGNNILPVYRQWFRPAAVCYSSDATEIAVANTSGEIIVCSTENYMPTRYITTKQLYSKIAITPNNYFVVGIRRDSLDIWDYETGELREKVALPGEINHISFSNDSKRMAVSCGTKGLYMYDTRTFTLQKALRDIGHVGATSFNKLGKYMAVIIDSSSVSFMNVLSWKSDYEITQYKEQALKDVRTVSFCESNEDSYLLSNTSASIITFNTNMLAPVMVDIQNVEVDKMMNEWVSQMDGESMDDYKIRVNEESRMQQQIMFEEQVATALAGERVSLENPFVAEEYDIENSTLSIGFEDVPPIQLEISAEEAKSLDNENLTFSNAVYMINENDEFEIAYVEVRNEVTNKVYIYNNVKRQRIQDAFETNMDNTDYIPLEFLQIVNTEEIKLQEKKQEFIEEKKNENFITGKVDVSLKTEIQPDVDTKGNKIYNYDLKYQYDVQEGFSAEEDFPPGGYLVKNSHAALSMLQVIKKATEEELAMYLTPNKVVEITVTGTADGKPIRKPITYKGWYGVYNARPYYLNGKLASMTVGKSGIAKNEQLAFIRAAGVAYWIRNNVTMLQDCHVKYIYKVELSKGVGGDHRKIEVNINIKDAFQNK